MDKLTNEDLNDIERWENLSDISREYKPNRYARRDMHGNTVDLEHRAEAAKEYLESKHWGHKEEVKSEQERIRSNKLKEFILKTIKNEKNKFAGASFKLGPLSLEELKAIRKKFKKG